MEAGPSRSAPITSNHAVQHPLPPVHFYSVEYPGYVQPSSVPQVIRNLGGPSTLETAFKRGASKSETLVELDLKPGNPFAHPIAGEVVGNNSILLKIRRRRRKKAPDIEASSDPDEYIGDFKAEVVGVLHKTVRFRC